MKRWLSYIVMAVLCGLCLSSCTKDEQVAKATDDGNVPVHLTLAFSNFGGRAVSEPGEVDYTTVEQSVMSAEDVYVLVVGENNTFLYQVTDLTLGDPVAGDNYYTRQLEGTMKKTADGEKVKLVVLANLKDNAIGSYTTGAAIRAFLEGKIGSNISEVYSELVYNYSDSAAPWDLVGRPIPMWGSSTFTEVPGTGVELSCNLYRAVAKVGIWVNMQDGYEGFAITKIVVNNANNKGNCVSAETPDTNETIQYTAPSIPSGVGSRFVTYDNLNVAAVYENKIYLPEKANTTDTDKISLTVHYTYNNQSLTGEINFQDSNGLFDVIRNHSYLFNIQISDMDATLSYEVTSWVNETIGIPVFK